MRSERAPWTREITEAIMSTRYREIVCIMGSQTSKTDGVQLNTIGWQLHYRHKPILFYAPTEKNAKAISARCQKMITLIPELYAGLDLAHDNVFEKFVFGTRLGFGWAGSKTEVASHPAEVVLADEIDRYEEIPGEGSAWQLMKVRISTYPSGKQVGTTSPTVGVFTEYQHPVTGLFHIDLRADERDKSSTEGLSLSGQLFIRGTRQEFMVPCPHCHLFFALKSRLLWWPLDADPDEIEKQSTIVCPHCAKHIPQHFQNSLVDQGRMIAPGQTVVDGQVVGDVPRNRIASYHVNGLNSRWKTWGERALALANALKSNNKGMIRATLNTEFGEWYAEDVDEVIDWQPLAEKRRAGWHMGTVPEGVEMLTAFFDVQLTRLIYVVCGWSEREGELETHLIDCGQIEGNTFYSSVWIQLDAFLRKEFDGRKIRIAGIDSGFNPSKSKVARNTQKLNNEVYQPRNIIYDFVRKNPFRIVMTKGTSHAMLRPYTKSLVDVHITGRVKKGLDLWVLDTDYYKTEVYAKLNWPLGQPGEWHYPVDTPDEFFKQLASERKNADGQWIADGENHFLDCMVGNLFLSELLGFKKGFQKKIKPRRVKQDSDEGWD